MCISAIPFTICREPFKTKNPKLLTSGSAPYKMAVMVRYGIGKWLSTFQEDGGLPDDSKYMAVIWILSLLILF